MKQKYKKITNSNDSKDNCQMLNHTENAFIKCTRNVTRIDGRYYRYLCEKKMPLGILSPPFPRENVKTSKEDNVALIVGFGLSFILVKYCLTRSYCCSIVESSIKFHSSFTIGLYLSIHYCL